MSCVQLVYTGPIIKATSCDMCMCLCSVGVHGTKTVSCESEKERKCVQYPFWNQGFSLKKGLDPKIGMLCFSLNPFTATVGNISGLKSDNTRMQTEYFPVLRQINNSCMKCILKPVLSQAKGEGGCVGGG